MPKLKDFKVGDVWLDGTRREFEIVAVRDGVWPVIAVDVADPEWTRAFRSDGRYTDGADTSANLAHKKATVHQGYWNVYAGVGIFQTSGPWSSRKQADEISSTDGRHTKRVACVKIEIPEGRFDD